MPDKPPMTRQEAERVLARFHICPDHLIRMEPAPRNPQANSFGCRTAYLCAACELEQSHADQELIEEAKKALRNCDAR